MILNSKSAINNIITCLIFSLLHLFVSTVFLSRHCHYTTYFFPVTVTLLIIYFQTLLLYFYFPDTVIILLISFQTLLLYYLFISRHCHYRLISFQTLSLYFLFLSGHRHYILISFQRLSIY